MRDKDTQLLEEAYLKTTKVVEEIIHNRLRDYVSDEVVDKGIGYPNHIEMEKLANSDPTYIDLAEYIYKNKDVRDMTEVKKWLYNKMVQEFGFDTHEFDSAVEDVKHILKNGPEQAQSSLDDPDFSFDATQRPDLRYA